MVQRAAVAQRNADHRLLGRRGRLGDGFGHFARLAMTEAGAALAVADDDQRGEAEALAALHRLGDAVDVDELLDQLLAAVVVAATAATTIVATATAAATIVTAAAAATATAATRTAAASSRRRSRFGGSGFARSRGSAPRRRLRPAGFRFRQPSLELQSAFAGGIGQRLDAAMEQEAAAVEHDLRSRRPSWRARRGACRPRPRRSRSRRSCRGHPCPASRPKPASCRRRRR